MTPRAPRSLLPICRRETAHGYTDQVMLRRLPFLLALVGAVAAWTAARYALFAPVLWVFLLVAALAVPVAERRFVDSVWLGAAVLLVVASLLVGLDRELAGRHSLQLLLVLLLVGLARRYPPDDTHLHVLALAVAATSVVALLQTSGGLEQAQAQVQELPRALREAAASRLLIGRAFGTASLPGHFAVLLLTVTPLLLDRVRSGPWAWRAASALGLAGVATGIFLTRSLAVVAVGVVLLAVALVLGVSGRRFVLVAGAAFLLILMATLAWRTDIAAVEPVRLRLINWRTALAALGSSPWLGVGLGGIGQAGLAHAAAAGNITPYTHNTYLQLLAEVGLAGAPVVVAGILWLGATLRAGLRQAPALALAVLVVPLHNLVDFSAYMPEVVLPWAVLVGALAARVRPLPRRATPAALLVPLLALGCGVSVAAWRGETAFTAALSQPAERRVAALLTASAWQPWTVTTLLLTADVAVESTTPAPELKLVDEAVAARWWVRPSSSAWAQARASLLLSQERRGEALVWAREARRRAPFGPGLKGLEAACAPR